MATEEEVTLSAEALTEPVSTLLAVVSIKRPVLDDFLEEWMETLKTATSLHNSATSLALLETICRDHLTKASKYVRQSMPVLNCWLIQKCHLLQSWAQEYHRPNREQCRQYEPIICGGM